MSYNEIAERLCPDYMAMGMSYDDYWEGDPEMVVYYRKANLLKEKKKNYESWLQGFYIYEALLDASPMFHDWIKNPKPLPYPVEPHPLYAEDKERQEQKKQEELDKKNQETVRAWAKRVNRLQAEKEAKKGAQSDGG